MSAQTIETPPTLDINGVQPADVIVTRNGGSQSKVIRYGSCSSYSHAILALGNGLCIEAIGKGVRTVKLSDALYNSTYGALYRHESINSNIGAWVCHFAKEEEGKPYDYGGALRSGVSTGCSAVNNSLGGVFIQLIDEIAKKGAHDDSFFCSELIVYAFEKAGLDIIRGGAQTASPGALVKSPYLTFIKSVATT